MCRPILILLFFLNTSSSFSQTDTIAINEEFERLDGEWEGYFEFGVAGTNRTSSFPAKCTSRWSANKWNYEVFYDEGEGSISGGKGEALATADGKTIFYNGALWNIIEYTETGDSTAFILEITGKEKRKMVTTRHNILITSTSFFITESSKMEGEMTFKFSNKHHFRRKK